MDSSWLASCRPGGSATPQTDLLVQLREQDHTVFDVDPTTGPDWSAHLALIADATLLGRTDSWYMAANVPGKPRQLLNYPSPGMYTDRLRQCAADGYDGFQFSAV